MNSEVQSSKFISWSLIAHALLAIGLFTYQLPAKDTAPESISIEILDVKRPDKKEIIVAHEEKLQADKIVVKSPVPQKMIAQVSQQPVIDDFSDELSNVLKSASSSSSSAFADSHSNSLDIPELEAIKTEDLQTSHINPTDLVNESEFSVIASKSHAKVQKMGAGFARSIKDASNETDRSLSAQSDAIKNEASKRGQYLAQRKNQIGEELGSALAQARTLDQLKQMPNNPKPSYSEEERLWGHQGQIVFLAFINKEGAVSDFKLMKSTGHKNLDLKTFAALKKWRFYPGQEGWVELPYVWSLKGGTQEMPTLLRREISKK